MRDTAEFLRALADETRLMMLWLLSNRAELCVCDLMAVLEITQSKASRHLATLRHAGLVTDRKDGLWSHYSLRPLECESKREHMEALRRGLARRPDAELLLRKLEACLAQKDAAGSCFAGTSACGKRTVRRPASVPTKDAHARAQG
jgi:ArsR family transcriptional regulator